MPLHYLAALHHKHGPGVPHAAHGHAGDCACRVLERRRVDRVVGADDCEGGGCKILGGGGAGQVIDKRRAGAKNKSGG
jgi:hypothetical protein